MKPFQTLTNIVVLLAAASLAAFGQTPKQQWTIGLQQKTQVQSAGEYKDNNTMVLESFTALCMEPSSSASFQVAGPETRANSQSSGKNHMIFHDQKAGLKANAGAAAEPFFVRAEGSITALTWIDGKFSNPILSGEINTDGGVGGNGSYSRQGLMARWDQGNNFYWFYVDFATGSYAILRSRFFGLMDKLPGSTGQVPGFKNTSSYFMEFQLQNDTMQGRIYELTPSGNKGKLLVQTGTVKDSDPFLTGISGYLSEPSLGRPFEPLHGSFGTITSTEQ